MNNLLKVCVVDPKVSRRNEICQALRKENAHTESCASVHDIAMHRAVNTLLFVADQDGLLEDVILANDRAKQWLPIVAYSDAPSPRSVMDAARAGATDYLAWPASGHMIQHSIQSATLSSPIIGKEMGEAAAVAHLVMKLGGYELEILNLLNFGKPNKEIDLECGFSPSTIQIHRANMLQRLDKAHAKERSRLGRLLQESEHEGSWFTAQEQQPQMLAPNKVGLNQCSSR